LHSPGVDFPTPWTLAAEQERTDEDAEALKGLQAQDRRDVSPSVIKGLVKIMGSGSPDKRRKATIAMCNLCCESTSNRACAHSAGIVAVLVGMMREENEDEHLRRLAVACICNLSADPPLKVITPFPFSAP
jgi:hypothetical protein